MIATGSSDYTVRIWNLELQRTIHVLEGHTNPIWCLIPLNDILLISGSEDCILKVWDWEYGLCVRTLLSHTYAVWGLAITSMIVNNKKEPLLGSASWDKSVKVWQLKKL